MLLTASTRCQPRLAPQMSCRSSMSTSLAARHSQSLLGRPLQAIHTQYKPLAHHMPRSRGSLQVVAYKENTNIDQTTKQVCHVLVSDFRFSQAEAAAYVRHPQITKAIAADSNLAIEAKTFRMKLIVDTGMENATLKRVLLAHPELFTRSATALKDTERLRTRVESLFVDVASNSEIFSIKEWAKMLCASPEILLIEPYRAETMLKTHELKPCAESKLQWWSNLMDDAKWAPEQRIEYVKHALIEHPRLIQARSRILQREVKTIYLHNEKDLKLNLKKKGLKMTKKGTEATFKLNYMHENAKDLIQLKKEKDLTPRQKQVDQRMAAKERAYEAEEANKRAAFDAEITAKWSVFKAEMKAREAAHNARLAAETQAHAAELAEKTQNVDAQLASILNNERAIKRGLRELGRGMKMIQKFQTDISNVNAHVEGVNTAKAELTALQRLVIDTKALLEREPQNKAVEMELKVLMEQAEMKTKEVKKKEEDRDEFLKKLEGTKNNIVLAKDFAPPAEETDSQAPLEKPIDEE